VEQQQQTIGQLQQQIQAIMAEVQGVAAGAGAPPQAPMQPEMQSKNMLPDGSQVGGRESNMISQRPNGV
jgi:hypothetical protein